MGGKAAAAFLFSVLHATEDLKRHKTTQIDSVLGFRCKLLKLNRKTVKKMVVRAGIEPTTHCLEGSCSIH